MVFICDSLKNTIPHYDKFEDNWLNLENSVENFSKYNYTYYNDLKVIKDQYGKLSDNYNLACVDLSSHLIILPTFIILSFIFSNSFICCKKDKITFIIFELISIVIKGICIFDKILFELKKQKLLSINYKNEKNIQLYNIYKDYEQFRKKGMFSNYYLLSSMILLGLEIIIFLIILCINCRTEKNINNNNNDNINTNNMNNNKSKYCRWSIIYYTVFGFLSIILYLMGNFIYFNCKLKYRKSYEEDKIFNYKYDDYPILKEIIEIYNNNNEKWLINKWNNEIIYNLFFWFSGALFIFTVLSYVLLFCFKCKGNCKVGFIIFEVFSAAIKIFMIIYSINNSLKGLKKNLENYENPEIKFLIDDYHNYYKCKIKYPIILIIQIIYLLAELLIMLCIFKKNEIINDIPITHEIIENHDEIPVIPENNENEIINDIPLTHEIIENYNEIPVIPENNENEIINDIPKTHEIVENHDEIPVIPENNENETINDNPQNNEINSIYSEKNDIASIPDIPKKAKLEKKKVKKSALQKITIEIKFKLSLFKDNNYSIKAGLLDKFNDVFDNLVVKYEELKKNKDKIIYIILGKEVLYSHVISMSVKSIIDLDINNDSIIHILFEETINKDDIHERENIDESTFNAKLKKSKNSEINNNNNNLNDSNNLSNINMNNNMNNNENNNNNQNMNNININNNMINNINNNIDNPMNMNNINPNYNLNNNNYNNQFNNNLGFFCNNDLMNYFCTNIYHNNNYLNNNNLNNEILINFVFNNLLFSLKIKPEVKFNEALRQLVEQYPDLKNYIFEEIYLMRMGQKLFLQKTKDDINTQTIQNLNISNCDFIYIYGQIKGNILFNLRFKWINKYNKDYILKVGNKETFNNVVINLIQEYKDLEDYIITKLYRFIEKKNEKERIPKVKLNTTAFDIDSNESDRQLKNTIIKNDEIQQLNTIGNKKTNENYDMESKDNLFNDNNNSININNINENESSLELIQDEYVPKKESLECLNINENTIIFFETRENIMKIENKIKEEEMQNYQNSQEVDKLLLKYTLTSDNSHFYYLYFNKKLKFSESIDILKTKYPSLKDKDIIAATNNGNSLLKEDNKNKKIEELDINYNQHILLIVS